MNRFFVFSFILLFMDQGFALSDRCLNIFARSPEVHDFIDGSEAIFHPLPTGSFERGSSLGKHTVQIRIPFSMQVTPLTQAVWFRVAQLINESGLSSSSRLPLSPSHFDGIAHPVENVSYTEVQKWIEGLNQISANNHPELYKIFPQHQKNQRYRLPTSDEFEYFMSQMGTSYFSGQASTKEEVAKIYDYANFGRREATTPVYFKKPLQIAGGLFYDVRGNVRVFVQNSETLATEVEVRGGSWSSPLQDLANWQVAFISANERYPDVGFRLVTDDPL